MLKIKVGRGPKKAVAQAEKMLETELPGAEDMLEGEVRLKIQALIDESNIHAPILINGNTVWSKKRIINNLQRIMAAGRLYGEKTPHRELVGGILYLPVKTDPILSHYFYEFLHLNCGSIAHYSIDGWIAEYPTLDHLKRFFKKNEFGKRVLDDIPSWETDVKEIVQAIEILLFPLEVYARNARKAR
jgi:hypothetical protein